MSREEFDMYPLGSLRAGGYEIEYMEFNGVHSELNWQDWLADGLVRLLGG